jgi:hypothetical protein
MNILSQIQKKQVERERIDAEIKELQQKQSEFDALPEDKRLAELIHDKVCHWNHTDGCDWDYETWGGVNSTTRERYLEKARNILASVNYAEAIEVIKYL